MIQNGAKRTRVDKRDYSYHRTFSGIPTDLTLADFNLDAGLTMPDQNAEGLPFGCTGETQTDCLTDLTKKVYKAKFTYDKTCLMENHGTNEGCEIRNSMKSLRVFGAQEMTETTDLEATKHKGGQTFSVDKKKGYDYFDSFRLALRNEQKSISVGSPWPIEWARPQKGVLTALFVYDGHPDHYSWHNWKVCGETTILEDGVFRPVLIGKSWQGKNYGEGGFHSIGREAFNKAFDIYGTIGLIQAKSAPGDIQTIQLDIRQTILDLINRMLSIIGYQLANHA